MDKAALLAQRLAGAAEILDPWPHAIIDDFLPTSVFASLQAALPDWRHANRTRQLPQDVLDLLTSGEVEGAIRQRWSFTGGKPSIELTYRVCGLKPHCDRADKLWSGILYVRGHPTGTTLHYASGATTEVSFIENRLLCWGHRGEEHSIANSLGRFAIQWWFLR